MSWNQLLNTGPFHVLPSVSWDRPQTNLHRNICLPPWSASIKPSRNVRWTT
ncbi:hypothetical protein CRENBAI_000782 [Crenichthys baileyi]|uniref:Uncharacterized protein n=1 Tax=Crenichthys baileyi TaxID=28760 RepID=A0AAV9RBV6_9TELE